MSLIYSAISALENQSATAGMPPASPPPRQPAPAASKRWVYAAGIGSVAAVVIGGAALAVMREQTREVAPSMAAPVQAVAPVAAMTPAPAPVALAEKPVEPAAEPLPAEVRALASPAATAEAPPRIVVRAPRPAPPVVVESVPVKPAGEDLNRLTLAARQAIDAGNKSEAESLLLQLAALLPPESITLLRLRAWQALRNDDQAQAMALYGRIAERLPGDEPASINLAVLNWKAGQRDEARRIVNALAEQRPDSDTVRRYVAQFGEKR